MYSQREQRFEIIQMIFGISFIGMFTLFQFSLYALPIESIKVFASLSFQLLGSFLFIDIVSTVIVLFSSQDFERHKFYRLNMVLIASIVFSWSFLVLPVYLSDTDSYEFVHRNWITFIVVLIKSIPEIRIIRTYQKAYSNVLELT